MLDKKSNFEKFFGNENLQQLSYQYYFEEKFPEITSIISAIEWINLYVGDNDRGFRGESPLYSFLRKIFNLNIQIIEKILGRSIFVKSESDDFPPIESRFKKIISILKEREIISSFRKQKTRPDLPSITSYNFRLNPIPTPRGNLINLEGSLSGSGFNSNEAVATAVAETLERYSLCCWKDDEIIKGCFNELSASGAINPLLFKSFSDLQLKNSEIYRRHYFNADTKFGWVKARNFLTDETCLVPAQLAYLKYALEEGEAIIRHTTTSGAAAGENIERAVYSGFCETIERDAFMIFWLNKIVPFRINVDTIKNEKISWILNQYKCFNLDLRIFDITTDLGVPTFFILVIDKKNSLPALYVSAAADLDADEAILHVLTEGIRIGSGFGLHLFSKKKLDDAIRSYPNLESISERACWWSRGESIKDIEWLLGAPQKPFHFSEYSGIFSYRGKYDKLKEIFLKNNLEAYIVDIKNTTIDEFGLNVVMTLVPGFYTLYLNENYKHLGVKRLYDLPVKLGYFKESKKEDELNKIPHPML